MSGRQGGHNDIEIWVQLELFQEPDGTAFISGTDNCHGITPLELYEHLFDTRDNQEILHRARAEAVNPLVQRCQWTVEAQPVGKTDQRVAGSFGPHHETPGC